MMEEDLLTEEERSKLLYLAREALEIGVCGQPLLPLNLMEFTPRLRAPGATFVTLMQGEQLRGCIGALEAYLPLAEDVREHAVAAALQDFRFVPVQPFELPEITVEISRLTTPKLLEYDLPGNLPTLLRPGIDGVVLQDGLQRATFLPQVWEKIAKPEDFLSYLCYKMGAPTNLWQHKKLTVKIYQVEKIYEAEPKSE